MADSDGDTILLSQESVAENVANPTLHQVFAWVRPHSPTACAAFDAVVNASHEASERYEWTHQFLHLDDYRGERASSIYTEDGESQESGSQQWFGAFKLSLSALPRDPSKGWTLGSSPDAADLLLALPHSSTRIAERHARLFFHPDSCQLMLEARHTVTTTKNIVEVFRGSASRVISHGELFEINNCSYTLEYANLFTTPRFEEELFVFMKNNHGSQWSMNKLLSPTSVGQPLSVGKYYCSPSAFAQGTFGKVSAGWTQNGVAVAIKVFKNPSESEVRSHVKLMQYIGQHTNVVHLLDCVYHFDTGVPDAYSVYAPLAVASLAQMLGKYEFDLNTKLILLVDYLNGLSYLNDEKQIMHRDINPNNLAVTSFENPKGIILDLDAATSSRFSRDHGKGTIPYLAPEIVALKTLPPYQEGEPYEKSVDVWALGLSAFALHTGQPFKWAYFVPRGGESSSMVTKQLHAQFHRRLVRGKERISQDAREESVLDLIIRMTGYEARHRPAASEALATAQAIKPAEGEKGTITLKGPLKRRPRD